MEIAKALAELRKEEKRKFIQSLDLLVSLQNFDSRKESVNTFVQLPHAPVKKICAFLTKKSHVVDTITKEDFDKFKDEGDMKRLAKSYDFFIAVASLMPGVASKFGKVLGPVGKMPSPQAGVIPNDSDDSVKAMVERMKKLVRVRTKDRSIKIAIGSEDMSDKELEENIKSVVASLENALPKKKDNIRSIKIKFTMTKPIKIQ
jgi:large subunit ribosomal protein L1